MEDDDEIRSQPSRSPSPPPAVTGNGRIAVDLAGASSSPAAPPRGSSDLAFPVQHPTAATAGGGGGREDCWSDGSTGVLIGAWGERYLGLNRGNLKEKHWKEVADIVGGGGGRTRPPRTFVQCKYRIDTVKRKYKLEKAKIAAGHGPSKWAFFDTIERIIGPTKAHKSSSARAGPNKARQQPPPVDAPAAQRQSQSQPQRQPISDSDTESDKSKDLPAKPSPRRQQPAVAKGADRKGMGELTRAVRRFVEVYERAETVKMRQAMEMEKQRMRMEKEAELQWMELMVAGRVEMMKMTEQQRRRREEQRRRRGGGSGSGSNRN